MFTLPNGITVSDELEYRVFEAYQFCCVFHIETFAVTLHHEPPRSRNPGYRSQPSTWYPVCLICHDDLHRMKRDAALAVLHLNRDLNYPKVREILCQMETSLHAES